MDAFLTMLTNICSDHIPLLINIEKDRNNFKTPFIFELIWLRDENLEMCVHS